MNMEAKSLKFFYESHSEQESTVVTRSAPVEYLFSSECGWRSQSVARGLVKMLV